jgi:hypothetical protein
VHAATRRIRHEIVCDGGDDDADADADADAQYNGGGGGGGGARNGSSFPLWLRFALLAAGFVALQYALNATRGGGGVAATWCRCLRRRRKAHRF